MRKNNLILIISIAIFIVAGASTALACTRTNSCGAYGCSYACSINYGDTCNLGTQEELYNSNTCKLSGTTCIPPTCCDREYFYLDADRDGYPSETLRNYDCAYHYTATGQWYTNPSGNYYMRQGTFSVFDCNDTSAYGHPPGAAEICGNGIDDNCNGQVDENCPVQLDCETQGVAYTYKCLAGTPGGTAYASYTCPTQKKCYKAADGYAWDTSTK
jgi:hypothetical protein